jgi:hypothetical protein
MRHRAVGCFRCFSLFWPENNSGRNLVRRGNLGFLAVRSLKSQRDARCSAAVFRRFTATNAMITIL